MYDDEVDIFDENDSDLYDDYPDEDSEYDDYSDDYYDDLLEQHEL